MVVACVQSVKQFPSGLRKNLNHDEIASSFIKLSQFGSVSGVPVISSTSTSNTGEKWKNS